MEPLDSDYDYVVREQRESNPLARFNWLYVFPILGIIWLLFLAGSAIFQWQIDGVIDPVMTLMIILFFAVVGILFWAFSGRRKRI